MNDTTNAEYHANTKRIGKSGLDLIHQSPAHYYAKYLDPNRVWEEPTPELLMGSLVHTTVLEPHLLMEEYCVAPKVDRRTKIGKEEWDVFQQMNAGKAIVTQDQWDTSQRIRDAVYKHMAARELLEMPGVVEDVLNWSMPVTLANGKSMMVQCKAKPDKRLNAGVLLDLKTTKDAKPSNFGRSVVNYRYDVQAAWYRAGHQHAVGSDIEAFVFIAVEKEPPFGVSVMYVSEPIFELGATKYAQDLAVYAECLNSNKWPCYPDQILELEIPSWAFNK
jgi:exodeoxyribonuclease VIII